MLVGTLAAGPSRLASTRQQGRHPAAAGLFGVITLRKEGGSMVRRIVPVVVVLVLLAGGLALSPSGISPAR